MKHSTSLVRSAPEIVDVHRLCGDTAPADASPDLLIEVPHGATATADYQVLAARLESSLPDGLVDFFHVNTDVGAFETALETARRLVAARPGRTVAIVRCRIPRTFIDCNRRIDAAPEAFREGRVTPGLMPWITVPSDRALLLERYHAYIAAVRETSNSLAECAAVLLLHTYGPYTVDVEVDADIVANLRRAYQADVVGTWPVRPELDVVSRDTEGTEHAPQVVVDALRVGVEAQGWRLGASDTYPMHPSTMAWDHVVARPGKALCLEVRRDLLADPFDPFVEMAIDPERVGRVAEIIAAAIADWGVAGGAR